MSDTVTLDLTVAEDEHYVIAVVDNGSGASYDLSGSATPLFQRMLNKVEIAVLPIAIAAAFSAPGVGTEYCRTVVRSKTSGSVVDFRFWEDDAWVLAAEPARLSEINDLNELLALPAREGSWVELDGE